MIPPGRSFALILAFLGIAAPAAAQIDVVVHGRVEDAVYREPVAGVRVMALDGSNGVVTDSTGAFALPFPPAAPLGIQVDRIGYLTQTFQLAEDAPSRVSVLLLEPAPIELEGIDVIEESSVTAFLDRLDGRRNSYSGSVRVLDRQAIERRVIGGTAYDLVRLLMPQAQPCGDFRTDLCRRARGVLGRVMVCIDDWQAFAPVTELEGLPIESVAMAEAYGPTSSMGTFGGPTGLSTDQPGAIGGLPPTGQIRIYTPRWMITGARRERVPWPLAFGC